MERAQTEKVTSTFFQLDRLPHHIDKIEVIPDLVDDFVRDPSPHEITVFQLKKLIGFSLPTHTYSPKIVKILYSSS